MGRLTSFPWYGAKKYGLSFVLEHLPQDALHFVDAFGGSAHVLLNAGPYKMETYNDLNGDVVHFFDVLRTRGNELIEALRRTPCARSELAAAKPGAEDDVERARRFVVRAAQARPSGAWKYSAVHPAGVSSAETWSNLPRRLELVRSRLQRVQLENLPAVDVIRRYDRPTTLFYCDPPYVHSARVSTKDYRHEMSDDDHVELAEALCGIEGRAVISGYDSDLYNELFRGWRRAERDVATNVTRRGGRRMEVIWRNFDMPELAS